MESTSPSRQIPSVEHVLRALGDVGLPRPVVVAAVRGELEAIRQELRRNGSGGAGAAAAGGGAVRRVRGAIDRLRLGRIQPVINATGVIVHTNLGRSPLPAGAARGLADLAAGYCNLEFDLAAGERGGRARYLDQALAVLCSAEGAAVVNNCAAALVLILRHFAAGPERDEVVISRGELVQIGGGFRVPEILEASGARLREVGTTNRTALEDYGRAIGARTALILKVHRSNFSMEGFVGSPPRAELAALARERGVRLVEDLGSGAVFDTATLGGGEQEPTPGRALQGGADLVCFSGDKLLGGPQAGIIAGRRELVDDLRRDPLFRALRCDKLVLGALQATVDLHLGGERGEVPILAMMHASEEELRRRAERLAGWLAGLPLRAGVGRGEAKVGGGSLPKTTIPSVTLDLAPAQMSAAALAAGLRTGRPPVVGYLDGDRLRLDLRTVFEHQDAELARAIRAALSADEAHDGTPA